jgi:hypothetical protein
MVIGVGGSVPVDSQLPSSSYFEYFRYYQRDAYIDNNDPVVTGYSETGTWGDSALLGFARSDTRYTAAAGASAKWTANIDLGATSQYRVAFYNVDSTGNDTAAVYQVWNGATMLSSQTINTNTAASGWIELGTFTFTTTTPYVKVIHGNGNTRADMVRFVANTIFLQTGDPGYLESGVFGDSTATGFQGVASRFADTVGDFASWRPSVPIAGTYAVYGYKLLDAPTGDPSSTMTVTPAGAATTTYAFPQTSGTAGWNLLGNAAFPVGAPGWIRLNRVGAGAKFIRADAVKLVYVGP